MDNLANFEVRNVLQVLNVLFAGVLFAQSGLDKVLDFKGNKDYIQSVFSKTFLNSFSGLLFLTITLLEVAAGLCCLVGVAMQLTGNGSDLARFGLFLSAVSILGLFTGQRIAKDYAGAASLTGYFLVIIFGLYCYG